ncbi:MAG: manganese efflux pump MntP family protein [Clostridia bacterium]|nr:manganese efflux pump MntP family protein [Clostridia bacterium]
MFITVFLTGVGLSMDAFAVAICKGLKMQKLNYKQMSLISLFFGGFQALMPFIGWLLGYNFKNYIESFDHWLAFALLAFIGGKMIFEAFKNDDDDNCDSFDIKELFVMAIATSIDAMAAGIAFAFDGITTLPQILISILIIGVTTAVLSAVGVVIGHKFGAVYKSKAELAGGIILILIGLKILLEHLGVLKL